jgi:hypothetical protein
MEKGVMQEAVQTANAYAQGRAIGDRSPFTIAELLCLGNPRCAALGYFHRVPSRVEN